MKNNKKIKRKAFTIIELIVIMAIIAILVLLASPKFLNGKAEAKATRIVNDIKVVDNVVEIYASKNNEIPAYADITKDFNDYMDKEKVYTFRGLFRNKSMLKDKSSYRVLSDDFIKEYTNTKLKGVFAADDNYNVYYIDETIDAPNLSDMMDAPIITITPETWTNKDVVVNIDYYKGLSIKQYKIDNGEWQSYTGDITVSKNSTIYARGIIYKNVYTDVASKEITNIDKIVPDMTLIHETKPTNKDIEVLVIATDDESGIKDITVLANNNSIKEMALPKNLTKVTDTSYTVSENGIYTFKAIDIAGNETTKTIEITNIDKIAPVITIEDYIKTPTNQDIKVTALTNEGTLNETSHTFTANGIFTFVAIDEAGNITERCVTISNIDKIAPELALSYDIKPTNKDIIVSVKANDKDSGIKEITMPDGSKSTTDTNYIVSSNGSYTFKAIDIAGNETTKTVEITNIDKIPPTITIGDYIETPTNKDITVTASIDKGTLNKTSHTFTENGSFTFIATDEYGNKAEKVITITNIDKIAPVTPTLVADRTNLTNKDVTVTITYSSDSAIKEYKIGSGRWESYTGPIVVTENTTICARGIDLAGNVSGEGNLVVNNIDKVPPVITIVPYGTKPTNKDITVTASVNKGTLNERSHTFIANGSFTFKATDEAGNVTTKVIGITNIDKVPPNSPTVTQSTTSQTTGIVILTVNYPSDAKVK